ncbi:hypothetical protein HDE_13704 [Halotydeus destructor]|nr:hypothetical protein HDE_13704 [Halotydeus destructor]
MGCGASSHAGKSTIRSTDIMSIPYSSRASDHVQVNGEIVQQFVDVEYAINDFNKRYSMDNYQVKAEQLDKLEEALVHLARIKDKLHEEAVDMQRKMGYRDLQTVKDFVSRKSHIEDHLSKDEEQFMDVLNRQEVLEKELETLVQQRDNLKMDIDQMNKNGNKLNELFAKRDEILDTIFQGQYGSTVEQQLEKELDWLLEQKHHVDQAHFRWKQAQLLCRESCSQLSEAIQKWKDLTSIAPDSDNEEKYFAVAEARNLLVSASQNIQGALRYLPNINVPYCSSKEAETLEKAISYVFTDMQTRERHEHALNCYQTTYKRVAALSQWLGQVINSTISRDLGEISDNCKSKASELRNERIRLIKSKLKDMNVPEIDSLNGTSLDWRVDSGVDSELDDSVVDEQLTRLFSNKSDRKGGHSLTPDPTRMPLVMPTPVPSADLAPMPSNEEIFGKIEQLRSIHKRDVQELSRAQKLNQARMVQDLKEKLNQRRSRRTRLDMHSRQMEALRETP